MTNNDNFAVRLTREANKAGKTINRLCEEAGIKPSIIYKLQGERSNILKVEVNTILRLCHALHCSSDYLLGLSDDPTPHN